MNSYDDNLNRCREYRRKYPSIDNGKEIVEPFNAALLKCAPRATSSFANLNLKFMKITNELDIVNQNIWESYDLWEKLKTELQCPGEHPYLTYHFTRYHKLQEYVVYDLKRIIDEIIATVAILKGFVRNNCIQISSIGEYLDNHHKESLTLNYSDFDAYVEYFKQLNNLHNSYKHSYRHSQMSDFDLDANTLISIYQAHADYSKEPKHICVSMKYIVDQFNSFYELTTTLLRA